MPVVTIQGEMGSRASEIGKQVADRLHASYFDSDIAARVAQQAGSSEREVKARELPTQFITQLAEAASRAAVIVAAEKLLSQFPIHGPAMPITRGVLHAWRRPSCLLVVCNGPGLHVLKLVIAVRSERIVVFWKGSFGVDGRGRL